jgi:hypothetical protein
MDWQRHARSGKFVHREILVGLIILTSTFISGCAATLQDPDRIYSVQQEMEIARQHLTDFEYQYSGLTGSPETQRLVRNEIISTRMYIIDANYSQYEANFGRQNAQLGFAADSASQGLNTAGALFVAVPTVRILSGVAGGITGIKGSYQSDLLGSKTVDIIQAQMRANRDEVATQIIQKMGQSTSAYPLPLAYTDLETYYRAGTFASGVLKAAEIVGANAADAQDAKADARIATNFAPDDDSDAAITRILAANPGNRQKLKDILASAQFPRRPNGFPYQIAELRNSAENKNLEKKLVSLAKAQGL